MLKSRSSWTAACLWAGLLAIPAVQAAPADDVKALLEKGNAAAAYAEAKKHPEQLGDPAFDFWFGLAAIDGGRPGEGVLALERYLLAFPDNASARLHLARGYFVLGDDAHAKSELEALRKAGVAADVATAIDGYLDAIRLRQSRHSMSSGLFIEAGLGYDGNVNAGPASAEVFLPGFGFLPLDAASRKISAPVAMVGGGAFAAWPVRPGLTIFANAQFDRRYHEEETAKPYTLATYGTSAGAAFTRERHQLRFTGSAGAIRIGTHLYRSTLGVGADWQFQLDGAQALTAGAQFARLTHRGTNTPRDADYYGVNVGYRRQFAHAWQPVVQANAGVGEQRSRLGFDELVPRTVGLGLTVNVFPAPRWGVLAGYAWQRGRYQGPDFFAFPEHRRDTYEAFNAAVTYLLTRELSLRLEAASARNRSNADAYAFPRDNVLLKLRYEIK